MKFLYDLIGALIISVVICGCSQSDGKTKHHVAPVSKKYDVTTLASQAKGEVIVIGTLATIGSFEWGTAPLATTAAVALKHIPQELADETIAYKAGKVSQDKFSADTDVAQAKINAAVKVRDLLKAANLKCRQNGAGKCTGDQVAAETLVDEARSIMAQSGIGLN